MSGLRVVDSGEVGALRSQALWHGIASAMTEDAVPTLSFCRPREPYVGLGYHRALDEIDRERCRVLGLRVIRRRIGGGPVWVDADQLFFQLTVPAHRAPARVDLLYRRGLGPAVDAFRRLGLAARIRGLNDIAVADRKISGTGAGRIGDGVTVVGNVIFRFPHRRMAEVLALPSEALRGECLRLLERHVSSLEQEGCGHVSMDAARSALIDCYARALGLEPRPAALSETEELEIRNWENRLSDADWLAGPPGPAREGRQIKISADAWLWSARDGELAIFATVVGGRIERLGLEAPRLNGVPTAIHQALAGIRADPVRVSDRLARFGVAGERVARLLVPGLRLH